MSVEFIFETGPKTMLLDAPSTVLSIEDPDIDLFDVL